MAPSRHVAVVGPSNATDVELATAEEVGRRLAEAGCIVVTGGLGGVMAAAARGAASASGISVGVLPGTDSADAADALTVVIPTGLGEMRNALVVRSADAVIAIGGSWGTLSEISLAMRTSTPIVSIGGWRVTTTDGENVEMPRVRSAAEAVAYTLHPAG
jgi:hypothetical protein